MNELTLIILISIFIASYILIFKIYSIYDEYKEIKKYNDNAKKMNDRFNNSLKKSGMTIKELLNKSDT